MESGYTNRFDGPNPIHRKGLRASTIPEARDPEVLSLFTCLINKLQSLMTAQVPRVFEAVFKCTLDMITKNFEDFPEHRANLFNLLRGAL